MSTSFHSKYKILEKVGEGSFSDVLKCQDRQTGALYAAKRLKKIYQNIDDILESPEVMATRKVAYHPNVLCMVECHYDMLPGRVTLIFELMDMSLYDLMKNQKGRLITEVRVRNYIFQLLRGLEHLHKYGIFHRDVKPENILLKGGAVKIGDLGSVREVYSRPPYTEYISTRWYRSPECLLTGGFYGPKMDVWAAGCVFFELITLEPLFPGDNEVDQIARIHGVLGTPHARLIAKIRRTSGSRSRHGQVYFPAREGRGLDRLLPGLSASGLELLTLMLVYDPENRPAVRRLLEHRYFAELQRPSAPAQPPRRGSSSVNSTTRAGSVRRQSELLLACLAAKRGMATRAGVCPTSRRELGFHPDVIKAAARLVASTPNASRNNASVVAQASRADEHEQVGRYFLRKRQSLQANRSNGQQRRWQQDSVGKWQSPRCCGRAEQSREDVAGRLPTGRASTGRVSTGRLQEPRQSFFLHEQPRRDERANQFPAICKRPGDNDIYTWDSVVYKLGDHSARRPDLAEVQKRAAEALPRKVMSGKAPLKKMARRDIGADCKLRLMTLRSSKQVAKKSSER